MSAPDTAPARLAGLRAELREASAKVRDHDGSATQQAGHILALAGDLLRRSQALGDASHDVDEALAKIGKDAAAAFVASLDPARERRSLEAAMNAAFECLLADEGEAEALARAAMEGLVARDRLASVDAAMAHAGLDPSPIQGVTRAVDAGLVKKARMLVALNAVRRDELGVLNTGDQEGAWWFSARARCDELRAFYLGEDPSGAAHLASCPDCRRDVRAAASTRAHKPDHIGPEALWRRDSGDATPAELRWMDGHLKECRACAQAVRALHDAEEE